MAHIKDLSNCGCRIGEMSKNWVTINAAREARSNIHI